MPLTSRFPIEAQSPRISFEDEPENVGEKIICRVQDKWGSQTDWTIETVSIRKTSQKFSFHSSHLIGLYCSFPVESLDWGWPSEEMDWTKFRDSLHERLSFLGHYDVINVVENVSPEKEFNELASQWYQETRKLSSADQMVLHPAYQKIIGMGKDALPLIFKELKRTRGHWIWALAMITRDDKAQPGMNFREAVDAWLAWGENNGYI
jgi:hypothetical protein